MNLLCRIGVLAAAGLLAACQGGSSKPAPAELVPIQSKATPRVLWQGNVGAADKSIFFPARAGRVVYAVGASGGVTGFDVASGAAVARFDAGQRVSGGVGAGGGVVLLGTQKGEVLAFNDSGKPLWQTQLAGEVLAPPEIQDGTVVVRAANSRIYGLDATSGKQKWIYQRATPTLSLRTHSGLTVERGAVFAGFPGGRLVGLALSNGNVGWDTVISLPRGTTELERVADISSPPALDGPRICAAAYQGRLACLDSANGTVLWARDVSSLAGVAIDERSVYVTDEKNAVIALDKNSGASLWRQDKLAGRNVSAPLALGRYVVVGDIQGYVHILSREDGAFAARIATDGSPIHARALALDLTSFLVQTRNGGIYAITIQ